MPHWGAMGGRAPLLQAAHTPTPSSSSVGKVFFVSLWVPSPASYKLGVVVHTCHPSSSELDVGVSKAGGYNMFEASLGYMRKASQKQNKKTLLSLWERPEQATALGEGLEPCLPLMELQAPSHCTH